MSAADGAASSRDHIDMHAAVESALHDAFAACTQGPDLLRNDLRDVVDEIRNHVPDAHLHADMDAAWRRALRTAPSADDITWAEFAECYNAAVDMCMAHDRFKKRFQVVGTIGSGAFADVQIAFDRELRTNVAIKTFDADRAGGALAEVRIWRECVHPHIIRLHDVIPTAHSVYIVLELAPGGELLSKIEEVEHFDEARARDIFRQIAAALAYLHDDAGVAHRDIKPENLLCTSIDVGEIGDVKLSDFGFAVRVRDPGGDVPAGAAAPAAAGGAGDVSSQNPGSTSGRLSSSMKRASRKLTKVVGTPDYMAPEQVRIARRLTSPTTAGQPAEHPGHYDEAVDCWALGCIAYELLNGAPPFVDPDDEVLFDLILNAPVEVDGGEIWDPVSADAKDLIRRLLERDPERRLTAREALEHPWVSSLAQAAQPASQEDLRKHLVRQESRNRNRQMVKTVRQNRRFRVGGLVVSAISRMSSQNRVRQLMGTSPPATPPASESAPPGTPPGERLVTLVIAEGADADDAQ